MLIEVLTQMLKEGTIQMEDRGDGLPLLLDMGEAGSFEVAPGGLVCVRGADQEALRKLLTRDMPA